jgi:hypothetical protein
MKKLFLSCSYLLPAVFAISQSIGIGTATPDSSAILDLKAIDKGMLIPRVSTTGRIAIKAPAKGLMVYDTTLNKFFYYTSALWAEVGNQPAHWSTLGNSNLPFGAAFGTNDATNLLFKVNGVQSGSILWGALATTSFGYLSAQNPSGSGSTAFGHLALQYVSTGSDNTAVGVNALRNTNTGHENTAMGSAAMILNTSGFQNTAVGAGALFNNNSNNVNTAIGYRALYQTTASDYNVALGAYAGANRNNGYNNVFLGANTDVPTYGLYNVILIGQGAAGTASSQVTIGNASTSSYRAYAGWTNISDGRFKKNVKEDVPGLAFVNQLRPVTYNLDATGVDQFLHRNIPAPAFRSAGAAKAHQQAMQEKEQQRITGFVAQEVEQAAKRNAFNFSGVDAPKNENDLYGLRYSDFVVPLVKAVQELSAINNQQQQKINELEKKLGDLQLLTEQMKTALQKLWPAN